MQEAYEHGLVVQPRPGAVPRFKRYLDQQEGRPIDSVWTDIPPINSQAAERLGYPTQKPLALLERIVTTSSNENDIVLDAFCGCGTALVAAQKLKRQWIGLDISPTACRVMAKRLKKDCGLKEEAKLQQVGRGFIVRDLPKTEAELRKYPPFEFENWAVVALGGTKNARQVGDMGIDGRIYPISAMPERRGARTGEIDFMDEWYPIQVKQTAKVGRPDIDAFEAVLIREERKLGYFVGFDFTGDALFEIDRFRCKEGLEIKPLTVREILDEEIKAN
jgi:DNA methylase